MSRILICNIIPNNLVHLLDSSQAANNFCFNLIENECFDKTYSIVPVSYYDDRIISKKNVTYFVGKKKTNKYAGLFSILLSNIRCAFKASKMKNIWFYNIVNANILSYLILRYIFNKKVYVLLLDYTPRNNIFSIQSYFPYLIRKSIGVISISTRTEIRHPNMDYIAGIIPIKDIKENTRTYQHNNKLRFLFSGNLGKHTGYDLAIEVFKKLPECELIVSGSGELSSINLNKYKNIKYLGYLPYDKYLEIYDNIDICLSFRDPKSPENRNNFPSKVLEYFSHNKLVLSTIEYPELCHFNYFTCDYKVNSIINTINGILKSDRITLDPYFNNIDALKNNFSEIRWRNTLKEIEKKGSGRNN